MESQKRQDAQIALALAKSGRSTPAAGINVENDGAPVAPGGFTTIDLAPGLTATNEGGGVARVTPSGGGSSPAPVTFESGASPPAATVQVFDAPSTVTLPVGAKALIVGFFGARTQTSVGVASPGDVVNCSLRKDAAPFGGQATLAGSVQVTPGGNAVVGMSNFTLETGDGTPHTYGIQLTNGNGTNQCAGGGATIIVFPQ